MNNIVHAQYYANKVCKSCASLAGFFACCLADVIGFCCNLQPCMLHVASCIAVVIGVLLMALKKVTELLLLWSIETTLSVFDYVMQQASSELNYMPFCLR